MHKVLVTDFAKESLKHIYEYFKVATSVSVAQKIKSEIKRAILSLKDSGVDWQEDEYLKPLSTNHRRLICGNYKIIYYRDWDLKVTYVTDVFDARQDPQKENP